MSIRFNCDQCGRLYELPEATAGKPAKCECGAALVVPTASTAPAAPPAKPAPTGKPITPAPRTLAQAAELARKDEPKFDPAAIAALADEKRREREASRPADAPPPVPPLPPPAPPSAISSAQPIDSQRSAAKKYQNLRAYCTYLSVLAVIVGIVAVLLTVVEVVALHFLLDGLPADPLTMLRVGLVPICAIILTLGIGILGYVFLRASAELLHVLMDIEENTRR